MKGILTDNNAIGHMAVVFHLLQSEEWKEEWTGLNLRNFTFADLELQPNESDSAIWHLCQREEIVLITNNRNAEGPDSLEETIRKYNEPHCLPVFTLADPDKIRHSRSYAERVVVRLFEYLIDIDEIRGAGRMFLP